VIEVALPDGDGSAPLESGASAPSQQQGAPGSPNAGPSVWTSWGRSAAPAPRGLGTTVENLLASQPWAVLWVEAIVLAALVSLIDFLTPAEFSFSVFYMIPVIFAAWFISRRAGFFIAAASVLAWVYLDALSGATFSSALVPVWNAAMRFLFFSVVLVLVSIMKESKAREAVLARTDSLTGVANGRSFFDRASLELATMRRTGRPMTVAYVDLDNFKHVNDTRGHSEGDRLLVASARAIRGRLRSTDMVARLGGDEFGILLPGTDRVAAPGVLQAIEDEVRGTVGGKWPIDCTIGAITFEEPPESVDFMVRVSDGLMYDGKRRGRGRVEHKTWPAERDIRETGE
jgi:diguanylate cyclase (GGDEF)-like protein